MDKYYYKYVLMLEDDLLFCPTTFSFIRNIFRVDAESKISINMVMLGSGSTAYLIKSTYIDQLIQYIQYFIDNKIFRYSRYGSIDAFMFRFAFNGTSLNNFNGGFFVVTNSVVHHFDGSTVPSVLWHENRHPRGCDWELSKLNWHSNCMYQIDPNTMDITFAEYQLLARQIYGGVNITEHLCAKELIQISNENGGFTSFNLQNCDYLVSTFVPNDGCIYNNSDILNYYKLFSSLD